MTTSTPGEGPASEPEAEAIAGLITLLQPDLGLWYHQDLFRIAPASGRAGRVRGRYAELTGLPVGGITGGTYTGTAASWQRQAVPDGVSFIVELGPALSDEEAGPPRLRRPPTGHRAPVDLAATTGTG